MAGYVWKGTRQEPEPRKPARRPGPKLTPGKNCGTRAGYAVHRRAGEQVCPECAEAENKYSREYRTKVHAGILKPATPFNPDACGTMRGYRRHLRHRIPADDACKAANAVYSLLWKNTRERKRAADRAAKQQ